MSKPTPATYRTTNWRSYNAALKRRGSLLIWFDPETEWLASPSGKRGRSATFTDAEGPVLSHVESAVRAAFAANDGSGCEALGTCRAGLARAGLAGA